MTITSVKLQTLTSLQRKANELGRQTADTGKVTAIEFNQLCYILVDLIGTLRQEEENAMEILNLKVTK